MNIPRSLIAAMDIITIQGKMIIANRPVRRTLTVTEIVGLGRNKEVKTNNIYTWNKREDTFEYAGRTYIYEKIIKRTTHTMETIKMEIERRKKILQWMVNQNIRYYKEVSKIIREYRLNPDPVYRRASLHLERGNIFET